MDSSKVQKLVYKKQAPKIKAFKKRKPLNYYHKVTHQDRYKMKNKFKI